jgi:hypothetical protein
MNHFKMGEQSLVDLLRQGCEKVVSDWRRSRFIRHLVRSFDCSVEQRSSFHFTEQKKDASERERNNAYIKQKATQSGVQGNRSSQAKHHEDDETNHPPGHN